MGSISIRLKVTLLMDKICSGHFIRFIYHETPLILLILDKKKTGHANLYRLSVERF